MQKLFHSKIIILVCITLCVFITTNIHWGKDKWQNIIEADARGYYAYLPAVFIYQDLNFAFYDTVEKKKYNTAFNYDYRVLAEGKLINKYFCGTAIMQAPFFLVGHALSYIDDDDNSDGYSRIYMLAITIAGIFYLFLGLWFIDKLLKLYAIRDNIRSFTLIAILFGSNLFFYSVCEMGMSHIYSFAAMAMFSYSTKQLFLTAKPKYVLISIALTGLIFLIRPANLIILFAVPFLSGDSYRFFIVFKTLKKNIPTLLLSAFTMLMIMSIQLIIYKISTGHFWVDSYPGEEFHFTDPHMIDILFSYKKGLFLYTPIYLLTLLGMYMFWKKRKFEFFTFIFFFLILTYILSSWWNWWYGGSFSSRVYVEYLPVFTILLGVMLQNVPKKILEFVLTPIIILVISLCQFQTYQYRYYVIHWEDMTKDKYLDSFLRTKK